MSQRVILLQPAAPAQPRPWAPPCNGCGTCCAAEPCPLGMLLIARRRTRRLRGAGLGRGIRRPLPLRRAGRAAPELVSAVAARPPGARRPGAALDCRRPSAATPTTATAPDAPDFPGGCKGWHHAGNHFSIRAFRTIPRRTHRMKITALLAALAVTTALAAALAQRHRPSAQTLRWAAQNDILTLDPHSQNHATTNSILMHAYEGLTRYSATYQVEPALATKWTYITPDPGAIRTAQGREVPRRHALHRRRRRSSAFGRIKQPQGTMQIYVTGIGEIKKIDDHTVDLILTAPNPILLRNIIDFRIMSKAWAEKNKHHQRPGLQGQGRELRLAQRDGHGLPTRSPAGQPEQRDDDDDQQRPGGTNTPGNVKEVVYTPIKSDPTRVAALLSGDVDMLTDMPDAGRGAAARRRQAEDRRRPRGAHHLPRARHRQRRAEVQQHQGQEPVRRQACAPGAEHGHRP